MHAMPTRCCLTALLTLIVMACAAENSWAQGGQYRSYGGRYYSPYGPTLSPYLDYFRRDTGVLDPYNAFIRPRRQLQSQLADIVQQGQAENVQLQKQIQGIRAAEARPTGTGATFLNYSHYYRVPQSAAPGKRR